jgi:hypothetical protein
MNFTTEDTMEAVPQDLEIGKEAISTQVPWTEMESPTPIPEPNPAQGWAPGHIKGIDRRYMMMMMMMMVMIISQRKIQTIDGYKSRYGMN